MLIMATVYNFQSLFFSIENRMTSYGYKNRERRELHVGKVAEYGHD